MSHRNRSRRLWLLLVLVMVAMEELDDVQIKHVLLLCGQEFKINQSQAIVLAVEALINVGEGESLGFEVGFWSFNLGIYSKVDCTLGGWLVHHAEQPTE